MEKFHMPDPDTRREKELYRRAEKLVAEKIGFFRHFMIYVLVNVCLFAVNMLTSSEFYWFLLPLSVWSIILLAHFLNVFMFRGDKFERWRRKEIEKAVDKLRKDDSQ